MLNAKDSVVVAGTVTKPNGTFSITKINAGNFIVKVFFIGYETKYNGNVVLGNNQELNLNTIALKPSGKFLGQVTVTGKRQTNNNKIDKQTYQANQFESAKGGSAVDVLKNLPSVTLNGQGDISLRGSNGFLVLLYSK